MIRNINDGLAQGVNTLIPPTNVHHREVNVTDVGTALTFTNQVTFVDINNDSDKNDLFVVVGSTVSSIDVNNGAIRLKPKESLELFRNQIPDNTKAFSFQCAATKTAVARVFVGEE